MVSTEMFEISTESNNTQILDSFEEFSLNNGLNKKEAMNIRLLTEETLQMFSSIIRFFGGHIWAEKTISNDGTKTLFTINTKMRGSVGANAKEELLSMVDGKNAANLGVFGKITNFLMDILTYEDDMDDEDLTAIYPMMSYGMGGISSDVYLSTWSLSQYQKKISEKERKNEWYGLERSIIINMADDLVIGIKGRDVSMSIKKYFSK